MDVFGLKEQYTTRWRGTRRESFATYDVRNGPRNDKLVMFENHEMINAIYTREQIFFNIH
jgi:hypothetical protein